MCLLTKVFKVAFTQYCRKMNAPFCCEFSFDQLRLQVKCRKRWKVTGERALGILSKNVWRGHLVQSGYTTSVHKHGGKNVYVLITSNWISLQKIGFIKTAYTNIYWTGSILFISTAYLKQYDELRDELRDTFETCTTRKKAIVKPETFCEDCITGIQISC